MHKYDFIIVGSGFGGAITACRLSEAGFKVLVLERGKRWHTNEYPRKITDEWIYSRKNPAKKHGWLEFRSFKKMSVVQGAGVGGGSLVYANVSVEAKPHVFDSGWPAEISYQELKPYYQMVGDMLCLEGLPDNQLTSRYKLVQEGAAALGMEKAFEKLPLAVSFNKDWGYHLPDPFNEKHSKRFINKHGIEQGTCIHCGNCDIGCKVNARNTLEQNYIPLAERAGAEVRPLHLVKYLEQTGEGYRVHFDRQEGGSMVSSSETSRFVILAAGSINSTELLLRCRDQYKTLPQLSSFLGRNWSSNGDFLTPAFYYNRAVSPSHGPTITCAINYLHKNETGHRFFIEDGGIPRILNNFLSRFTAEATTNEDIEKEFVAEVQSFQKSNALHEKANLLGTDGANPFKYMMPWFAQGVDAGDGRLYLQGGVMRMDWNVHTNKPVIEAIIDVHEQLAEATGGKAKVPFTWQLANKLITPHPLGGCNMGNNAAEGVVNHKGEVFHYPGLYVADGAIVPVPLGLNPSRTIAALAERIAAHIVADLKEDKG